MVGVRKLITKWNGRKGHKWAAEERPVLRG